MGRPFLKEDMATIAQNFEFQLPVIEDALQEYLNISAKENRSQITFIEDTENEEDPDNIFSAVKKELKESKPILALAVIEAGLYSVNKQREFLESKRGKRKTVEGEPLEDRINFLRSLAIRYERTENFLFTHSEFFGSLPDRDNALEWMADEKRHIEKLAKDEKKEEALKKIYKSKLMSEVPAYERFLTGRQVIHDYDFVLSSMESWIQATREVIADGLPSSLTKKDDTKLDQLKKDLKSIHTLRSLIAILEGERNEKIALRR